MATVPVAAVPKLPLADGIGIPAVGFGVGTAWFKAKGTDKEAPLKASIIAALEAGFRHIDDAEMYCNEDVTGEALAEWLSKSGVPREEVFVTSKVISVDEPGVEAVCRRSLQASGLTYFDLYLVHAPYKTAPMAEPFRRSLQDVWKDVEGLVDAGLVKAIGVSNWRVEDLEQVYEGARIKPVCNQIEAHPYLQQPTLHQWCSAHNILVTAYSPLASLTKEPLHGGPVDAAVTKAAERVGRTAAQVLLRWSLQCGRGVVTTTGKPERLREFLSPFDFELSPEEVAAISAAGAGRQCRFYWKQMATEQV